MTTTEHGEKIGLECDFRKLEDVDRFVDLQLEAIRTEFNETGQYRLRAVLLSSCNGSGVEMNAPCIHLVIDPGGDGTPSEKDAFASMLTSYCQAVRAFGVLFSAETWMAPDTANAHGEYVQPRFHPKRREALFVTFEHVARPGTRALMAEITRDAEGKPTLGPWVEYPQKAMGRGRFADLLRPVKNGTN